MQAKFYYEQITDARQRGIVIHSQIEKFLRVQPCQLSQNIKKVVHNSIMDAKRKVTQGKIFIQEWFDTTPTKSRVDWGIKGQDYYIIIDWKTGTKTENVSYQQQTQKYQRIFEGRGQVWIINVETQQINKLHSFDSNELTVICTQCQRLQNIGIFWQSIGEVVQDQERQMGAEITYLFQKSKQCFCGNQMRLYASQTQYPIGVPGEFQIDNQEGCSL